MTSLLLTGISELVTNDPAHDGTVGSWLVPTPPPGGRQRRSMVRRTPNTARCACAPASNRARATATEPVVPTMR